jgi:hypothetical protein
MRLTPTIPLPQTRLLLSVACIDPLGIIQEQIHSICSFFVIHEKKINIELRISATVLEQKVKVSVFPTSSILCIFYTLLEVQAETRKQLSNNADK